VDTCGHPDAWFRITISEEGKQRIACSACVWDEVQELPLGRTVIVEWVDE
jgi:hypothetical protein